MKLISGFFTSQSVYKNSYLIQFTLNGVRMDGKFTWKTSVIPVQIIVEVFACTDIVEVCTITIKSVAVAPILLMTAVG